MNRILKLIYSRKYGNEIPVSELQIETGIYDERKVRKEIESLIDFGAIIGSNKQGYYKIRTSKQLLDTIAYRRKPALRMLQRCAMLEKCFNGRKQIKMRFKK